MKGRPDREDYIFFTVILTVIGSLWFAYVYQVCGQYSGRCIFNELKEWQTLLTGVLATLAAAVSIWYLHQQITVSAQLSRHERQRSAEAYRAMLSMGLADLCDLLDHDFDTVYGAFKSRTSMSRLEWPEHVSRGFEIVRKAIEFEDENETARNQLKLLVRDTQTYRSRRRDLANSSSYDRLLDCTRLYGLASDLFDYSREQKFEPRSPKKRIFGTLHLKGLVDPDDDPALFKLLSKSYPAKV